MYYIYQPYDFVISSKVTNRQCYSMTEFPRSSRESERDNKSKREGLHDSFMNMKRRIHFTAKFLRDAS